MTTGQKPIVLGVDLDGVCADFYARMREVAAIWFEKDIAELTTEVTYGLPEWDVKDYPSLHRYAVTAQNLFSTVAIIPGARKYLRLLSDEGYHIRIITHRLFISYFHAMAVKQTIEWLDDNGIPYRDLCFMKDKHQVGADIYIEDSPHNVEALRNELLYTICFANSTNKHVAGPRTGDWGEVYKLIKERAKIIRP
jgi:5'(3')-deoxyribonucleotidase